MRKTYLSRKIYKEFLNILSFSRIKILKQLFLRKLKKIYKETNSKEYAEFIYKSHAKKICFQMLKKNQIHQKLFKEVFIFFINSCYFVIFLQVIQKCNEMHSKLLQEEFI